MRLFSSIGLAILQVGTIHANEVQFDGDMAEMELYSIYEQSTGVNLVV